MSKSRVGRKMMMLKRWRKANVYRTDCKRGRKRHAQAQCCCLFTLAQPCSSPCFYSTACHQCSPALFRPRCGWCSAWPCDERRGPERFLMQLPSHILMSKRISTVPAWIIPFLWWLYWPCNPSTAALGFAQLDLIQQHLQDYIWQRSTALPTPIT